MNVARDLERIVNSQGTKADRARALFDLGCDRTDVTELLDMSYSQAHSIWKKLQAQEQIKSVTKIEETISSSGVIVRKRYGHTLQLSPSQVRFLTQNKHEVVKVDKEVGVSCASCSKPVEFSLRWLGFVHKGSKEDPTHLEDRYAATS